MGEYTWYSNIATVPSILATALFPFTYIKHTSLPHTDKPTDDTEDQSRSCSASHLR